MKKKPSQSTQASSSDAIPPTPESLAIGEELREVARTQVRTGEPPIARVTYERLLHLGHSRENAIELIATVLAFEMFEILKSGRSHDEHVYSEALGRLPDLP